jgi:SPP1 gp7 family putative phage head morphogenesis protein
MSEEVNLPSPEYWAKRMEEITEADMTRTAEIEKKIAKAYQKAQREIIKQIEAFVARYASENGMTYQQAIVYLNRDEFRQWRMDIEEFVERIEKTGDQLLLLELNTLSARSRITRLEQLLMQINVQLAELKQEQEEVLEEHFIESATETYYQTTFAVQQGIGMATVVPVLDTQAVQMILTMPWSGANYSERIWKDRQRLTQVLEEELVQHFIQGKDIRQTSKAVAERMEASYANAARLVRTESSYVANQATMKAYENTGFIEEYEFLATLDRKTSKVCQQQDGKRYKLSDAVVGVNYPPLHPHCRSTTIPVVAGSKVSERIARDKKGNVIYVPADMTYEQWRKSNIYNKNYK